MKVLITFLFSVLYAFNAAAQMGITSSSGDSLRIGESTQLTFTSSEAIVNDSFDASDVLVYALDAGEIQSFKRVDAKTYTATFISKQN